MTEIWKPVKDFEGYYEVSDLGRVRRLDRYDYGCGYPRFYKGRILTNLLSKKTGYFHVQLCKSGSIVNKSVHRLVAEAFIPNPDNLPQVNHKDEDKSNNVVTNLEWCDAKYNMNYGTRKKKEVETKIKNGLADPDLVGLTRKEYVKKYKEKYEYKVKANKYNYYMKNKEKIKERSRKYYLEHREEILSKRLHK